MKLPDIKLGRRLLLFAGYGAFALVSLALSLYLTFPADAVGQRLVQEVSRRSDGKLTMSFDSISPYRLSGIAAEGVRLRAAQEGKQPVEVQLDAVRVRLRLLPLLLFRLSGNAAVDLGDGTIEARLTPKSDGALDAELDVDDLDLAKAALLARLVDFPVGGVISGEAETAWVKDPKAATGRLALTVERATFGPGTVQGVTLPLTDLGTITPELTMDKGVLKVTSFKQQGGQVQLKLSGQIQVRPQVGQSALDLCVQVKPDPGYLKKNPKMEAALQLVEMRLKKDGQGFLNVPLGGTLSEPRLKTGLCRLR